MEHGDARLVRTTPERPRADEWLLALASAGIDARLDWSPQAGYAVIVGEAEAGRAGAVLDAYDEENRRLPPSPRPPEWGPTYGAITAAVVLCAFFVVTGPRSPDSIWFDRGGSNAARLADGEWWRAVTALTLHADFPHILGNAVVLLIFGTSLCALVGPGAGLWLMLLAGAGGNLLNGAFRGAPHDAVGASTAIFGSVGALAALQVIRRRQGAPISAMRAWAPAAAGLALLGFLGTSPRADVLAHLFGFGAGAALGAALILLRPRPLGVGAQLSLSIAAVVAVMVSWLLALG